MKSGDQKEVGIASSGRLVALSLLDRLGCGYLVVDAHRKIVEANTAARLILGREAGAIQTLDDLTSAFERLIARAPNQPPLGPLCWIVIWNKQDAPFVLNQDTDASPQGTSVVMLVDLDLHLQPNPFMLKRMFGLTTAETRLALHLARGEHPDDVARNSRVSPTTVRSQLAALFGKTQTRRQAELVKLLARIAILP